MEIIIGVAFSAGLVLVVVLFFVIGSWNYNRPHRVEQREAQFRNAQLRQKLEKSRRENEARKNREGYYTKSGQWVKHSEYVNWEVIYGRDGNRCHICGKQVNKKDFTRTAEGRFVAGPKYPTVDHVIPKSKGGSHDMTNLKLAHKSCNSQKSAKMNYG
jgi:5-methylcytosine-specific restriction endonuclease McrA